MCSRLKNSDDSGEDDVGKDLQSVEKEPLVSVALYNLSKKWVRLVFLLSCLIDLCIVAATPSHSRNRPQVAVCLLALVQQEISWKTSISSKL